MLADYTQVKYALGVAQTDTSQDPKIQQLLQAADAAVKNYCHRDFELTANYREYPFKGNSADLPLLQRPLRPVLATGNLTANSTTLSNIVVSPPFSAANIIAGMSVCVTGAATPATLRPAIPPFTTISNLSPSTSPTSVTMSNAATANATAVPICFGLDCYIDFGGNYGFGLNAYQNGPNNSSRLYIGLDYAPEIDSPDGSCKSGMLILLGQSGYGGGLWALAPPGWGYGYGGMGGYGPYGGPLTQALPPVWPTYPGCICVTYCAGLGVGAAAPNGLMPSSTTIPSDLTEAVIGLTCWMFNAVDAGMVQTQSESYQGYSRSLAEIGRNGLEKAEALGNVRDILSRYCEVVV